MLAIQADGLATHTTVFRRVPPLPKHGPSRLAPCAQGVCDASSSSGDEATYRSNIWNALLATLVNFSTGVVLQALLTDEEMAKVALSCRFACDALCAELFAWAGDGGPHSDGYCSSASDEALPPNPGNPLG